MNGVPGIVRDFIFLITAYTLIVIRFSYCLYWLVQCLSIILFIFLFFLSIDHSTNENILCVCYWMLSVNVGMCSAVKLSYKNSLLCVLSLLCVMKLCEVYVFEDIMKICIVYLWMFVVYIVNKCCRRKVLVDRNNSRKFFF